VETSPVLRAAQARSLAGVAARWHDAGGAAEIVPDLSGPQAEELAEDLADLRGGDEVARRPEDPAAAAPGGGRAGGRGALGVSATPLLAELRERIAQDGPITVERYRSG
jgi:hypothetical protein